MPLRRPPRCAVRVLAALALGVGASVGATAGCEDIAGLSGDFITPGGPDGGCQANGDCECSSQAECAITKPGTECSNGACACPPTGTGSTPVYCPIEAGGAADGGPTGGCVDLASSSTDCGACGHACFGACANGACVGPWEPLPTEGAPEPRWLHVAVWTGTEMFVWGGSKAGGTLLRSGGLYDPATRLWRSTSLQGAPSFRSAMTAVWDDAERRVIVWGGYDGNDALDTGAAYDPDHDTWTAMSTTNAPASRAGHAAVWAPDTLFGAAPGAAHGMLVWGGRGSAGVLDDGAFYDPALDQWTPLGSAGGPPPARTGHTAVWDTDGLRMLVFGGEDGTSQSLGDLWAFDPVAAPGGTWTSVTTAGAPMAREGHRAVWEPSAKSMLIWGGEQGSPTATCVASGGAYQAGAWLPIPGLPTAACLQGQSAVAIDAPPQMIVFGGVGGQPAVLGGGFRLDATLAWTALPAGPAGRTGHTAVAAGAMMIVWGGSDATGALVDTGALYHAAP